jgi:hypothetical protein
MSDSVVGTQQSARELADGNQIAMSTTTPPGCPQEVAVKGLPRRLTSLVREYVTQMSRPSSPTGPRRWPVRRTDLVEFLSSDTGTNGTQRVLKTKTDNSRHGER